jgi:hypothetical protein
MVFSNMNKIINEYNPRDKLQSEQGIQIASSGLKLLIFYVNQMGHRQFYYCASEI